jgi:hypothetical protein
MHTHHTHPSNAEPRSKNIPKVNIASGDAGIPSESQKESAAVGKNPDFCRLEMDSEKVSEDLAVNLLFKSRHPAGLKFAWFNPTELTELRFFSPHLDT